jgi:Putative Actinobacterial Holin-X, holin superfamily III
MSTAAPSGPGAGGFSDDEIQGSHETYVKGEVSSIGALIGDITADLSTLMRQEVALAKAEARESATRAGKGVGMLGGAGAAAFYAVLFLSIALWWALGSLIDSLGWSAVIVAVIWAIIAAVLASMGRKKLKEVQGMSRTVETAKQVPDALKGNEDRV